MIKAKMIIFIAFAIIFLALAIINIIPIPRSYSMRWILTSQISNIARKYSNVFSSGKLLDKSNSDWLTNFDNYTRKNLSNLGSNDEVIIIDFHNSVSKQSKPDELYTIFETFLFLREQKLNYNISAIACEHKGGVYLVTIAKKDFEKLYNLLDKKSSKRSEIAKDLAMLWAEENFYSRKGLILDEEDEYRRELVTASKWNTFANSHDGKFRISCSDGDRYNKPNSKKNSIITIWELMRVDYDKPGFRIEPGFGTIKDVTLKENETGFMYACWDENSNIWVVGESTGVTFIKYDGDKDWDIVELYEDEIPYPIKKVIEIKQLK